MNTLIRTALALVITMASADTMHFVFEVTRNGARAPSDGNEGFEVAAGMLTAQGMRQRFLQGVYNRKRYVNEYSLLDVAFDPK